MPETWGKGVPKNKRKYFQRAVEIADEQKV